MKRFCFIGAWFLVSILHASSIEGAELLSVNINLNNKESLRRGANLFMDYCSGCHTLKYLRSEPTASDLGLNDFSAFSSLSMPAADAHQWFGIVPPDLSLTAQIHGADWLYTYLKSFYADKTRPFGTNNILIPNVAMPNVLAPLLQSFPTDNKHRMTGKQFEQTIQDVVTFLVYVGEPTALARYHLGGWVITFLLILLIIFKWLHKIKYKKH